MIFMRRIFNSLRLILISAFDALILKLQYSPEDQNSVLIVRLDSIGDFVIWIDAAKSLYNFLKEKNYYVVLLCNSSWVDLATELKLADEIWELNPSSFSGNLFYRYRWIKKIYKAGFKMSIQPSYSRYFLVGDSIIRASNSNERVGSCGDEENISAWFKAWSNSWYTRLIPAKKELMMEFKRNAEFLRGMGISNYKAKISKIPPKPSIKFCYLKNLKYVVLGTTASWRGKEWPISKFCMLAKKFGDMGFKVVLIGGRDDVNRIEPFISNFPNDVINAIGKTTLLELVEIMRGASVVITNDTSFVHIAASVNSAVVCILGGGHFGRFLPYDLDMVEDQQQIPIPIFDRLPCFGCNWKCVFGYHYRAFECIKDISVDHVFHEATTLLMQSNMNQLNAYSPQSDV